MRASSRMRDIRVRQSSVRSVSASDSVSTSSRTVSGSCERDAAHRSAHNSVPLGSPVVGRSIRQVSTISVTNTPKFLQLPSASKAIARGRSQQRLTSASDVRKSASFVDRVNSTGPEFGARSECLLRRAAAQHRVPSVNGWIGPISVRASPMQWKTDLASADAVCRPRANKRHSGG